MYDGKIAAEVKARSAQDAALQLQKTVNISGDQQTVAGVSKGSVDSVNLGELEPIVIQHTAGTAAEVIKIGDYYDTIREANGVAATTEYSDTEASTWTAAKLASYINKGILIAEINYEVDNATQFAKPFRYLSSDASKSTGGKDIKGRFSAAKRSTDQNLLVKTLDLRARGKMLLLNEDNALFLTVGAGRTVTITLTLGAAVQ